MDVPKPKQIEESPTIEIDDNQSSNKINTSGQNNNQPDEKSK